MKAPSFYSDPHVQFLSQLLEEIGEGGMQVPRFQRPLVWDWDRRLELLRSILDGIPIGAIMVWRTNTVHIDCYDRLGPFLLTSPADRSARQYILDGVQRLSTLYGALHRPPSQRDISLELEEISTVIDDLGEDAYESGAFDVFYDPREREFVGPHELNGRKGPLMPLHVVFDSLALLRYQRSLSADGYDEMIAATDEVARAFRDYKLPVIPITTDDINMATRTFQRINSQGARMSETHMVHALTWQPGFDLQKQLSSLKSEVLEQRYWDSIDDDPILKASKAALNLDVYKTSADELSRSLMAKSHVIDDVMHSIARAADFLWMDCGIRSPDMLPYALQIVVLSEAFRKSPEPSPETRSILRAWLWITTYGELFAGMSGDRVQVAIADIRQTVETSSGVWTWRRPFEARPMRSTFDFRAARAKAFAFHLAFIQDECFGNRAGTNVLADAGRRGLAQVIPWNVATKASYSSPANRFVIHPADFVDFRDKLLAGTLSDVERQAHVISDKAMGCLAANDIGGFITTRLKDIEELERDFLRSQLGVFGISLVSSVLAKPIDVINASNGVHLVRQHGDSYSLKFGMLNTLVNIRLNTIGGFTYVGMSHAIFTPVQAGPYVPTRPIADNYIDGMRLAIQSIKVYYDQAVEAGHAPEESWLVEYEKAEEMRLGSR